MILLARTLVVFSLALASCSSMNTDTVLDQRSQETPFHEAFEPPLAITTERMRLAPLAPAINQLDYDACQASRDHLSTTMQWGGWPKATMTLEDNMKDLVRHWNEFENHEAYAYTVLAPEGEPVIGCVYLNAVPEEPRQMSMYFWVTEDQLAGGLDRHLVATVLDRVERGWPVDRVEFPIPVQNPRGAEVLRDLELELVDENELRRVFAWCRDR